jgi:archaellum component FlaC
METIEIIMAIVLLLTGWIASMVTYNYSKLITRGENSEKAINEMKEVDITLSNSLKLLAQEMANMKKGQQEDHEQLKKLDHEFGIVKTQHDDLHCQRPLPRKKRVQ